MSLRKLAAALLAVFALGAIMAGNAFAENEFNEEAPSAWYTGASPGTKLPEGETKTLKSEAVTPLILKSTVGGEELEIEAKGVECSGCTIANKGTVATADGILVFTTVKLLKPNPTICFVSTTITTKALTAKVRMKKGSTTIDTIKFLPQEGETFATIEITGSSCSVKGLYKVTGAAFAEPVNLTGVFAKKQKIRLSKAIQESAGTATSLKFGANAAYLTGEANNFLSPEVEFAAKEK